jgi:hypothetical protein
MCSFVHLPCHGMLGPLSLGRPTISPNRLILLWFLGWIQVRTGFPFWFRKCTFTRTSEEAATVLNDFTFSPVLDISPCRFWSPERRPITLN